MLYLVIHAKDTNDAYDIKERFQNSRKNWNFPELYLKKYRYKERIFDPFSFHKTYNARRYLHSNWIVAATLRKDL